MSPKQGAASERPSGRGSGGAVLRGLLLIAFAVLLGVVLLGATDENVTVAGEGTEEVSATAAPGDGAPAAAAGSGPDDREAGAADTTETTEPGEATETETEAATETETETEGDAGGTEADAEGTEADGTEGDAEDEQAAGDGTGRRSRDVTVLVANGSGVSGRAAELTEQVGEAGYRTAAPSNVGGGETLPASTVYFTEGYRAEAEALAATLDPPPQVASLPESGPVSDLRGAQVVLVLGSDLATD